MWGVNISLKSLDAALADFIKSRFYFSESFELVGNYKKKMLAILYSWIWYKKAKLQNLKYMFLCKISNLQFFVPVLAWAGYWDCTQINLCTEINWCFGILQLLHTVWADDPSLKVYIIAIGLLLIPYSLIRNLVHLAPFAMFANVLNAVGLIIIFQYIVRGLLNQNTRPADKSYEKLPLYFGTALFTYEGIGLVSYFPISTNW